MRINRRFLRRRRATVAEEVSATSYCPRCDRPFTASSKTPLEAKALANAMVKQHLKIQIDEIHDGAYEEWVDIEDDEKNPPS